MKNSVIFDMGHRHFPGKRSDPSHQDPPENTQCVEGCLSQVCVQGDRCVLTVEYL